MSLVGESNFMLIYKKFDPPSMVISLVGEANFLLIYKKFGSTPKQVALHVGWFCMSPISHEMCVLRDFYKKEKQNAAQENFPLDKFFGVNEG